MLTVGTTLTVAEFLREERFNFRVEKEKKQKEGCKLMMMMLHFMAFKASNRPAFPSAINLNLSNFSGSSF